jgi:hypothetical protein
MFIVTANRNGGKCFRASPARFSKTIYWFIAVLITAKRQHTLLALLSFLSNPVTTT